MIECFTSRAFDISYGVWMHQCIPPPPAPPFFQPSIEMVATQMWTFGLPFANKLSTQTLVNSVPICLAGHDVGPLIPDITPGCPLPANYAIMWPFSSRKIMFASSVTLVENQGVGCAETLLVPFPMMTCGDPVSAPVIVVMTNCINTVKVGMTPGDILLGVGSILISVGIDLLFFGLSSARAARNAAREAASEVAEEAVERTIQREVLEGLRGKILPWYGDGGLNAAKTALSAAAGFFINAAQGNNTGDIELANLGPGGSIKVGYSDQTDPATGEARGATAETGVIGAALGGGGDGAGGGGGGS
ncbi:hypothetical protein [Gaopeijia maritima]|uniref:Uncharacterized protein n=1 Tax=Gaopeijia maritima TaxID=3119007 RepID=A0ABU9EB71_9BACT